MLTLLIIIVIITLYENFVNVMRINRRFWYWCILLLVGFMACKDDEPDDDMPTPDPSPDTVLTRRDTTTLDNGPVDFSLFSDTYAALASPDLVYDWRHYNVHDPSIINDGEFFYCYNTDVAYGHDIRPGLQIRRSINLVEWEFVGWVFNHIPSTGANYIIQNGGTPNNGLWAPYAMKVGDEYRVYYSLASNVGRLSVIGLGVSNHPAGPFVERGTVVKSMGDNSVHTNAIDPSIIIGKDGRHWMYYGSSWDGIYIVELDPSTGLAKVQGDIGRRIAHRGFTGNTINGNIEGPEIIYNEEFDSYYLFIAYDWLETKYNVRVGRSDNPDGPFYDVTGKDMNQFEDDLPMILAPYRFIGHSGWQGVSHPAVFKDGDNFYMAHQGRPGSNIYFMVLHTRQIHWTEDGWPMVSPQRFATEEEDPVEETELIGNWERIVFNYNVVPGFAETQINPDFQVATTITLDESGTINGESIHNWTYDAPWLTLSWNDGVTIEKVFVERGRDWENEIASTVLFTGFDQEYTTIWGKKIE